MNYINYRLPGRVSTQFERAVVGKTDISPLVSGRERRNAAWAFKKMQFTANFAMLTPDAQAAIVSAFYAANAQLMLFRFNDAGDNTVTASPLNTASLAGTTNPVQLTKRYTFGPAYADRNIQAINACVVNNSSGGVVSGTVDTSLGLFTPAAAWGSGAYTWTGAFDCWVRFNSDSLNVTMQTGDISTSDVDLIEQIAYTSGS